MSQTKTLRQFTQREWLDAMLRFRDSPALWSAFEPLLDRWNDLAHFKYEDARDFDERWAAEEFELDVHAGQVKYRDVDWLRRAFESDELAPLAQAVGQLVFPNLAWEIVVGDAHAIAVDAGRTIVIDLTYGDRISAAASLALAGEPSTPEGTAQALALMENRVATERSRVARMMEDARSESDLH